MAGDFNQRFKTGAACVFEFAGAALLWGCALFLFAGGFVVLYQSETTNRHFEVGAIVTATILWGAAIWVGVLARKESIVALRGGPETAKTLIEKSVIELMRGSVLQQADLAQEWQALEKAPARDLHHWFTMKLQEYPTDAGLLFLSAATFRELGIASAAEEALQKVSLSELAPEARWLVSLTLAESLYLQNRLDEAERLVDECLQGDLSRRHKATFIDQYVCQPLFAGDARLLPRMEQWARKAIAIDPRNISLHGTLGGILAELGRTKDAEPFLKKCVRSSSPHDRAISTFYFGIIARHENESAQAKHLFESALSIWAEPWFTERVQRELAKLQTATSPSPK